MIELMVADSCTMKASIINLRGKCHVAMSGALPLEMPPIATFIAGAHRLLGRWNGRNSPQAQRQRWNAADKRIVPAREPGPAADGGRGKAAGGRGKADGGRGKADGGRCGLSWTRIAPSIPAYAAIGGDPASTSRSLHLIDSISFFFILAFSNANSQSYFQFQSWYFFSYYFFLFDDLID